MPKVTGGSVAAHRQATHNAIFEAFGQLVYERGYDAISLADIATATGMSRTTMYNYFPSKDALVVAYTEYEVGRYLDSLRANIDAATDPVEAVRTYIRMQLTYFASHHLPPGPGLKFLLSSDAYERLVHHMHALEQLLLEILRSGAATGVFVGEVDALAPLVAACINRTGPNSIDPVQLDREIATTEQFVLRALGA